MAKQGDPMKDQTIVGYTDDDAPMVDVDVTDDDGVEIVDDTPDEDKGQPVGASPDFNPDDVSDLEGMSKRVRQRIDRLRHEFHNEKRRANSAERQAEEALRYAQGLQTQLQSTRSAQTQVTDALAQSMQDTRKRALEAATAKFKRAQEDGNTDLLAEASSEMATAAAELATIKATVPAQPAQPAHHMQPQPQNVQPVHQPQVQLSPVQERWLATNDHWFNKPGFEAATGFAYQLDSQLRARGVDPNSDVFYSTIVQEVGKQYPEILNGSGRQRAPVSAAGHQGQKGSRTKVRLTQSEAKIAETLGIPLKAYARQKQQIGNIS